MLNGGRIQFSPPGISIPAAGGPGVFLNDSSQMWYLARRSHHYYQWVKSCDGKLVDFAIEYGLNSSGTRSYFGRIKTNTTVYVGIVATDLKIMYYVDDNGDSQTSSKYEVLTCRTYKSKLKLKKSKNKL